MTTKTCIDCTVPLSLGVNWNQTRADRKEYRCAECIRKDALRTNATQMRVNGKYVPKSHPLHKPGHYIMDGFGDMVVETEKTKAGYVYIITNPAWPGTVKVGKAIDDKKRADQYQTYSPYRDYICERTLYVDDVHAVEQAFHRKHKEINGEWYRMTVEEAASAIEQIVTQAQRKERKHVEAHRQDDAVAMACTS